VEALEAIEAGHSVLVSAPTGAGKTLVADYAVERAFEHGWRVVYTAPIKALSNQKYRDFRATHGDQVGIMTGDVTLNPDADLLIMTTEVFRNTLFDAPERLRDFRFVIHDEVHYLDDPDRGTVWEESIIHAPEQMRLVCLSATIPNVEELADWMSEVRGEEVAVVRMSDRPVPLDHLIWVPDEGAVPLGRAQEILAYPYKRRRHMLWERSPARLLDWLQREKLLPVLFFAFSRRQCEELAAENRERRLLDDEGRQRIVALFDELAARYECRRTPTLGKLRTLARAGVSYHHAGMLPVHKEIVERLFTSGLLRTLFATETFALGINMPARTVAFGALRKFDGERVAYMGCRDYGQMAGRAGRQGIDPHGLVVSMLHPLRDDRDQLRRVVTGRPEPVLSRWNPDYSTILSLYDHLGDGVLDTYERSFAKYQRDRRKRPGRGDERRVLSQRLELLKRTGFIESGEVTDKGRFTSRVNGYEIQAGHWYDAGLIEELDEPLLAVLLMGTVYEPRTDDRSEPPRAAEPRRLALRAERMIDRWRAEEWRAGLTDLTQEPNFGLTLVLERWMDGAPLAELRKLTNVTDGDLVRSLRLLLQFARQLRKALGTEEQPLRKKLAAVIDAVDRDEVDARRQLELGQDPLDAAPNGEGASDPFGAGILDDA
jgi:superfamily II RNA helicase